MLVNDKVKEERIELINSNIRVFLDNTERWLKYIKEKQGNPLICISFIGKIYLYGASKNLLFEKDLEKFKQDMYIYGKLCIMGRDSRAVLRGAIIEFCEMLMSNNKEMIDFFIRNLDIVAYERKKDEYIKSESDIFLARTVLLALKGDWEAVIKRADIYLNNPSKSSYHKYIYLEFEFLKALALKDSVKMKESIAKEYYEPYDFMKKFNLNTITKEEWLDWIYEYHYDVKEIEDDIRMGRFV